MADRDGINVRDALWPALSAAVENLGSQLPGAYAAKTCNGTDEVGVHTFWSPPYGATRAPVEYAEHGLSASCHYRIGVGVPGGVKTGDRTFVITVSIAEVSDAHP